MLNSTKTWQERFDEEFPEPDGICQQCELEGGFCDYCKKERQDIKQFISDLIAQTREETIREVDESNKDYLKKICWTDRDIRYFLRQYNKLKK